MITVHTLLVGAYEVNCYIVADEQARALVIDPGADEAEIAAALREHGLTVAGYLLTHGHMDHLCALGDLHQRFPAPVGLAALDARWAFTPVNQMPPYPQPIRPAGEILDVAAMPLWTGGGPACKIIPTPGHTPGGVCYYFEKDGVLFSGDTLFAGSVGRTDLPGSSERQLGVSLRTLMQLPPATRVFPGHGPATTIAQELRTNPHLGGFVHAQAR
ncbi:MAG: MBL fold metallo-hydrolase [bacterium]